MMKLPFVRVRLLLMVFALGQAAWALDDVPAGDLSEDLESTPELKEEHQWSIGVSLEQQDKANRLYLAGNAFFLESRFKDAKVKYAEALALWSHPSIHYNLALTLINLDAPLEANKQLQLAFKYGGAPLDVRRQKRAIEELKRTAREISVLEISTREPDCSVRVDGNLVETPVKLTLPPGKHVVSVTKNGFAPREYRLGLFPGELERLETRLYTPTDLEIRENWTPRWAPVLVTGTGAAMVVTGAVLALQAHRMRDDFDRFAGAACARTSGCSNTSLDPDRLDRANTLESLSTISYISGGVMAAAGVGWLWFNRTKARRFTPEQLDQKTRFAPAMSTTMLGAVASGRF